jgi:hypothetical protein
MATRGTPGDWQDDLKVTYRRRDQVLSAVESPRTSALPSWRRDLDSGRCRCTYLRVCVCETSKLPDRGTSGCRASRRSSPTPLRRCGRLPRTGRSTPQFSRCHACGSACLQRLVNPREAEHSRCGISLPERSVDDRQNCTRRSRSRRFALCWSPTRGIERHRSEQGWNLDLILHSGKIGYISAWCSCDVGYTSADGGGERYSTLATSWRDQIALDGTLHIAAGGRGAT